MSLRPRSEAIPSTWWRCSRCGVPAEIGGGFHCSVIATHMPAEDQSWVGCTDAGGPFFAGVSAKVLEDVVRKASGLAFLRSLEDVGGES